MVMQIKLIVVVILMWSRLHVRWGNPPHVTSPTWGPPPSCKQALKYNNKPKVSPAILNFYYLVFIVLITPKDFLRKMSSSSCDDKSKMTDLRIASECFIKSTVIMQGAPNDNTVQNHLNITLLNVFYYLNCRYRYIFIP